MKHRSLLLLGLSLAWFSIAVSQDTKENADFKLAVNLYDDKLYDLALEQFKQFVATFPNTQQGIEARFYLGLCQSKQGKFDDARLTFQNFALAFPDHPRAAEAWWDVAESFVALKNFREAALAYERVKTFQPKSKLAPGALAKSSEYFEMVGDQESAQKVLRSLIQDYAASDVVLPARLKLAQLYLNANQFELARAEAKRVSDGSKDPNTVAQALVLMARALAGLNKTEEALRALENVSESYRSTSSYYAALLFLGSMQRELGYADKAFDAWNKIDLDSARAPGQVRQEALLDAGDGHALRGEYTGALVCFEKAAAIDGGKKTEASFKAGMAAERTGDLAKAQGFLTKALGDTSLHDRRADVLIAAARVASEANDFYEALKLYGFFQDQFAGDRRLPEILLAVAGIYSDHLHDYFHAVTNYETIINRYAASPLIDDAVFGRAEALRLSGAPDRAVESYEDFLKRYPASDHAEATREALFRVRTFELKNKESGLEKLALLVGDVIAQQSRADLAFRLAEIYFHDLKDYAKATAQYSAALQIGLPADKQQTALENEAKALEYTAWKESKGAAPKPDLLIQAIAVYDSLLKLFPSGDLASDALIAQLNIRLELAAGSADVRKISSEFLQSHPALAKKDAVYFAFGESYRKKKSMEDAAQSYHQALMEHPLKDVEPDALFRFGESLSSLGQDDSASAVYQDYLRKYPDQEFSARAAWELARFAAAHGNTSRALDLYKQIEQSFFYSRYARRLGEARGDAYFKSGDFARAIVEYRSSMQSEGNDFSAFTGPGRDLVYALATCYDKLDKRQEAKFYYSEYLMRDDTSGRAGQAYYALATIARKDDDITLAAQYLQRASNFSLGGASGMNQAAFEAAELYYKNEEYSNAITRYNEVVEKGVSDSLKPLVLSRIVVSYFRLNNAKEADARAAAFFKIFPKQEQYAAEFEYERGMYFLRKDEYASAKKFFDAVLHQYPNTRFVPNALYGNARIAELSKNVPEATKLYESIIQKYENDAIAPRARLALGNLYYSQEQWDPAARQYKAILDSEDRAPDLVQFAMNNLIMAYKQLSLFDAALQLTRKYIDRFPEDPELMNKRIDIGVLYQKLGYYDQAVVHLQSLLDNADSDLEAEVRYYIGESYFYKGDYQQSILEFLKVPYLVMKRTKADWASTSYYMAGQAYEKMSKFDQAITMYKQILSRPGTDPTFRTGAQREIDRVNALIKANK